MQKTWSDYVGNVTQLCTPDFWDTLKVLRYQPAVITDQILKKFYSLLKRTGLHCGHGWPSSVRSLKDRIKNKAGWFWDNVLHECTIDLRRFELTGVNQIQFTFVDPLFIFIQQCNKLHASVCSVLVFFTFAFYLNTRMNVVRDKNWCGNRVCANTRPRAKTFTVLVLNAACCCERQPTQFLQKGGGWL